MKSSQVLFFAFTISILFSPLFAEESTCTRGEPQPIFSSKNTAIKSVSFNPISSHEANEQVVFKSGERLAIRNWGCESFALTFSFESWTVSGKVDPFSQASELLRRLASYKAETIFDLTKAAAGLDAQIKNGSKLKMATPYPVVGDGMDFPAVQLSVLKSEPGNFEFELTQGPL